MLRNDLPFDTGVPFTRTEAREAGISASQLRGGRYQPLFHGLHVSAETVVTPLVRARAALRLCPPGSRISHFTAAELWGAIVPSQPLTHVSCPQPGGRSQHRDIGSHRLSRHAQGSGFRRVPVSSPEQTFIDLAVLLPLVDLVVLGDSLVKAGQTTSDQLVVAASQWPGRGSRMARRAAGSVRAEVDSPMETRLRMLLVLAGFPEPVVNHIIFDAVGRWSKRFDLSYPQLKLVIEYDGRQHAENDAQWDHDLERREYLDGESWRLIVIRSKGIYVEPDRTLERISGAMKAQGARNAPTRFRPEWRRHFPGRLI